MHCTLQYRYVLRLLWFIWQRQQQQQPPRCQHQNQNQVKPQMNRLRIEQMKLISSAARRSFESIACVSINKIQQQILVVRMNEDVTHRRRRRHRHRKPNTYQIKFASINKSLSNQNKLTTFCCCRFVSVGIFFSFFYFQFFSFLPHRDVAANVWTQMCRAKFLFATLKWIKLCMLRDRIETQSQSLSIYSYTSPILHVIVARFVNFAHFIWSVSVTVCRCSCRIYGGWRWVHCIRSQSIDRLIVSLSFCTRTPNTYKLQCTTWSPLSTTIIGSHQFFFAFCFASPF